MNKTKLCAFLLAMLLLVAIPLTGSAASLGLTTGTPIITAGSTSVEYLDDVGFGADLTNAFSLDTSVTAVDSVTFAGPADLTFTFFGFNPLDPMDLTLPYSPSGGFDIVDDGSVFLQGDAVIDVGFREDAIEIQFGNLSGTGASIFGDSILLEVLFADPLGDPNPFNALQANAYDASVTVSNVVPTPIPIPIPVLPMFLSPLIAFGWLGRKHRSRG